MHDVIVICVGAFIKPTRGQPLENNWIASGIGKDPRFYSINVICITLTDSIFSILLINYNWLWHHISIHREGEGHHGKLVNYR